MNSSVQSERNKTILDMLHQTGVTIKESGGYASGTISNSDGLTIELLLFPDGGLTALRKKEPVKELIMQGIIADAPTLCQLFIDMVWTRDFPQWRQLLAEWLPER